MGKSRHCNMAKMENAQKGRRAMGRNHTGTEWQIKYCMGDNIPHPVIGHTESECPLCKIYLQMENLKSENNRIKSAIQKLCKKYQGEKS